MFQTKVVGNIKIRVHILCSITFSRKQHRVWDNMEEYGTVGDPQMIIRYGACAWHAG